MSLLDRLLYHLNYWYQEKEITVDRSAIRERRKAKKRARKLRAMLFTGGVVIVVLALVGYLVWRATLPPAGEEVTIMTNASNHVQEGTDPGPFNSDPPTSGRHYGQPMEAGFYQEGDTETQAPYPEGYILHSLEHGYVVFWYNCDPLDKSACTQLKTDIKDVMDDFRSVKLIGFPWTSTNVPLVMTSWGQLQRFETFDKGVAKSFVRANRNQSPEPNAP